MSCGWANDWGSHQVWYTGRSSDEKKLWPPAKGLTGVKPKELRVKTKGSGKPGDSVCELCVCRKWGNSPITSASDVKKPGFSSQWAHTPNPDCALRHFLSQMNSQNITWEHSKGETTFESSAVVKPVTCVDRLHEQAHDESNSCFPQSHSDKEFLVPTPTLMQQLSHTLRRWRVMWQV